MSDARVEQDAVVADRDADFAVLIPTYNGTSFLRRAILAHAGMIEAGGIRGVEIVVSDNGSRPETEAVVRELMPAYPFLRYIRQPRHFDTAEEHLFHACRSIGHEWVWFFGDDDLPLPGAIERLTTLARSDRYDFLFCNLRCFMVDTMRVHPGRNVRNGLIASLDDHEVSIGELVAEVGFQTTIACFSGVTLRRRPFAEACFDDYLAISAIYSHVAVYLDVFRDGRCLFIGDPLVEYRTGATGIDNWQRLATRRRHTLYAPWTIGIVRLFTMLLDRRAIGPAMLFRIREHAADHEFPLWVHLVQKTTEEIEFALAAADPDLMPADGDIGALTTLFSRYVDDAAPLEMAERVAALHRLALAALATPAFRAGAARSMLDKLLAVVRDHADVELAAIRDRYPGARRGAPFGAPLPFGQTVALGAREADRYLSSGFSDAEGWGRWTDGPEAFVRLVHPRGDGDISVTIEVATAFVPLGQDLAWVEIAVNGTAPIGHAVSPPQRIVHVVPPAEQDPAGHMTVRIRVRQPKSALDAPIEDGRALGLGIASIRLDTGTPQVAPTPVRRPALKRLPAYRAAKQLRRWWLAS